MRTIQRKKEICHDALQQIRTVSNDPAAYCRLRLTKVTSRDEIVTAKLPRPNITAGSTECVYTRSMVGLPQGDSPFPLTAKLNKLTITVDRPQLSEQDIKTLEKAEAEALDGKPLRRVQPGPQ